MKFTSQDEQFMSRALELAQKGKFCVSPNPMVGAVIVKNGKIIAEGWHKKFGGAHAEINALKLAERAAKDAVLYVNLEPCMHVDKKTPPCVPEVVAAGISRVVVAMKDPNPKVAGRGILALRKAGIKADVGCMQKEACRLNEKFVKWILTGLPYVGMKVAMSLDGKIATKTGESKWITSEESREFVRNLRDDYDAILVGINTVLKDDPVLAGKHREPKRIILDSKLSVPSNAKVLRDSNVIVVTAEKKTKKTRIELAPLLRLLGEQGVSSVFVEGGAEIFGSFIDEKLVDRFYWFIAPKIIGGREAKNAVGGDGVDKLKKALQLQNVEIRKIGSDIMIEGIVMSY